MLKARIAGPAIRSVIASPVSTSTRRRVPNARSMPKVSTSTSCAAR